MSGNHLIFAELFVALYKIPADGSTLLRQFQTELTLASKGKIQAYNLIDQFRSRFYQRILNIGPVENGR